MAVAVLQGMRVWGQARALCSDAASGLLPGCSRAAASVSPAGRQVGPVPCCKRSQGPAGYGHALVLSYEAEGCDRVAVLSDSTSCVWDSREIVSSVGKPGSLGILFNIYTRRWWVGGRQAGGMPRPGGRVLARQAAAEAQRRCCCGAQFCSSLFYHSSSGRCCVFCSNKQRPRASHRRRFAVLRSRRDFFARVVRMGYNALSLDAGLPAVWPAMSQNVNSPMCIACAAAAAAGLRWQVPAALRTKLIRFALPPLASPMQTQC